MKSAKTREQMRNKAVGIHLSGKAYKANYLACTLGVTCS